MKQPAINFRLCFKQLDESELERFLLTQKDELYLPDRHAVKQVLDLVFEKGGIVAGFDTNNRIQAMFGFFIGDPNENYSNKDLLFVYVAAISKTFRLSRTFLRGLASILYEGDRLSIDKFRMQASVSNQYLNRLYSKISNPIGESKTLRGYPVMVYAGTVDDLCSRVGPNLQSVLGR